MADASVLVNKFSDFLIGTGLASLTGPQSAKQFANKYHAYLTARAISGAESSTRMWQGGQRIRADLVFKDNQTHTQYTPGQERVIANPQLLTTMFEDWGYHEVHRTYRDDEILLNEKLTSFYEAGFMEGVYQQFDDLERTKMIGAEMAMWNGIERSFISVPDVTTMEGQNVTTRRTKSLFALVNEEPNGLWGTETPRTDGAAWSTVHGIDPSNTTITDGQFKPFVARYTSSAVQNAGNILAAFDDVMQELRWELPNEMTMKQYFETPSLRKKICGTTKRGQSIMIQLQRDSQDRFFNARDPGNPNPIINGLDIIRMDALEGLAVFPLSATAAGTEFSATNKGPRYFLLDFEHLFPILLKHSWMTKGPVQSDILFPDVHAQRMKAWFNWVCPGRRYQAVVAPTGSIYTA